MAWRNLDRTGAECKVNSAISNNRNHPPDNWKDNLFAHQSLEALISGINRHCGIAEVGLRSGSRHGDKAVTFSYRIAKIIQIAGYVFMLDFQIRKGSLAAGTPVYNSLTSINQTLII